MKNKLSNYLSSNYFHWDNRPAVWNNTWEREPYWQRDLIASRLICLSEDVSPFIPSSSIHPYAKILWDAAKIQIPSNAVIYEDENNRLDKIIHYCKNGQKISIQSPLPEGIIPPSVYQTGRELLLYLNNKSNLDFIVPQQHRPLLFKGNISDITYFCSNNDIWPIAIKAGMAQPSMGGDEVFKCNSIDEVNAALKKLDNPTGIIIEEWISSDKNLCIQFFIDQNLGVLYLGATEQIIKDETKHTGNYIDDNLTATDSVMGILYECSEKARSLGYSGVVGYDVLIDSVKESFFIIDANFRFNGSTIPLILSTRLRENGNKGRLVSEYISFPPNSEQSNLILSQIEKGNVIPTSIVFEKGTDRIHMEVIRPIQYSLR